MGLFRRKIDKAEAQHALNKASSEATRTLQSAIDKLAEEKQAIGLLWPNQNLNVKLKMTLQDVPELMYDGSFDGVVKGRSALTLNIAVDSVAPDDTVAGIAHTIRHELLKSQPSEDAIISSKEWRDEDVQESIENPHSSKLSIVRENAVVSKTFPDKEKIFYAAGYTHREQMEAGEKLAENIENNAGALAQEIVETFATVNQKKAMPLHHEPSEIIVDAEVLPPKSKKIIDFDQAVDLTVLRPDRDAPPRR